MEYGTCLANLVDLAAWYETNQARRNEATTRLQLIDRLFFDCLGWTRDDVASEESFGGQYADYTFLFPRKLLIIEAKKEGTYFEMPVGQKRLDVSIHTLLRTTPELRSAMEQVAGYCQQRGVPYAGVTNGHQLVVFVGSRSDGTPPFEGNAIVFSSMNQMVESFLDLWNLLSKPAFEEHTLRAQLLTARV